MPKICSHEGCKSNCFSKGLCRYHWGMLYGKRIAKKPFNSTGCNVVKLNAIPIKKVSKKLATDLVKYRTIRVSFLRENPLCQAKLSGCTHTASEVHHQKGRGIYLCISAYFLAVCRNCHDYITENSKEAIEKGLSYRRNTHKNHEK